MQSRVQQAEDYRDRGSPSLQVLLVDKDEETRAQVTDLLAPARHQVHVVADVADALETARVRCFDLAIVDIAAGDHGGFTIMRRLRALEPNLHIILVATTPRVDDAVAATKAGARYLIKPVGSNNLLEPISAIAQRQQVQVQLRDATARTDSRVAPILGRSPLMKMLRRDIDVVAQTSGPVLISGESGSGKALVAHTLHERGPRSAQKLLTIDCAGVAADEQVTELSTALHQASSGTLLLDEVSALGHRAQAELVRALEHSQQPTPGADATIRAEPRIIATTRRDLQVLVTAGGFREDLHCLLGEFRFGVPPLRKRRDDLPLLVAHFVDKHWPSELSAPQIAPETWALLASRAFRGNVRELELVIKHAIAFADDHQLRPEHMPGELREHAQLSSPDSHAQGTGADVSPLDTALSAFEHQYLHETLQKTNGNRSRAAKLLGISRKRLWSKLKRYRENPPLLTVSWSQ